MAGKQRSAKNSRIRVGSINLNHAKWDAEWQGDDLDTTNFESGGKEDGLIGIEVVIFSGGGHWDAGRNPFDSPPGIFPRADGGPLSLLENVTDNVGWTLPLVRFLSSKNSSEVRGLVTFDFSGRSNGVFTQPTGSV